MPLRPPEFVVSNPSEPFEKDLLDRKPRIEALTRVIVGEEGPAVISINGGFGSGKSAFLKMLAANLRLRAGVDVQEFNAWQQSYTDEPLVDLVSALGKDRTGGSGLIRVASKYGRGLVKGLASTAVGVASAGLLDLDKFVPADETGKGGHFGAWMDAERNIAEFQEALQAVVEKGLGKIVVVVDELDRCRPDYAIDLLNVVRHLLAVPGVVAVLGVNLEELGHRVNEVFGPKTKADVYLRRFVDLPVELRPLDEKTLDEFSRHALATAGLSGLDQSGSLKAVLELLVTETGASARDFEQLARRVATILSGYTSREAAEHEIAVAALLLLRQLDRSEYEAFITGRSDAFAAATTLRKRVGGVVESGTRQAQNTLEAVEGILMRFEDEQGRAAVDQPDFEQRYQDSGLGDVQRAQRVRYNGGGLGVSWFRRPYADLIEFFA